MTSLCFLGVVLLASVALELIRALSWTRRGAAIFAVLALFVAACPPAWGAL